LAHLLKITNPMALRVTLMVALTGLWIPIFKGLLQGRHQFAGLGWLQITDGMGRFAAMLLIVLLLHGKATGAMFAAFSGQFITLTIGAALTWSVWRTRPKVAFDWRGWVSGAIPLSFGLGTILMMSSLDMLFVQSLFDKSQATLYSGAMLTGFAIIQFIAPVALVMFARAAQSMARREQSDSLRMTLTATILFGCVAAVGCTFLPKLPLQLMYFTNREMWKAAPLVSWFAWALLPLTVANVLVQHILARAQFKAVPWLLLVPAMYAAALGLQAPALVRMPPSDAFIRIIQTMGLASTLLCIMAALFSRGRAAATVSGRDSEAARAVSHTASSPTE
jgi:O-antigen/teichoic acid export membrane protein